MAGADCSAGAARLAEGFGGERVNVGARQEHVNPHGRAERANLSAQTKVSESLSLSLGFLHGPGDIDWQETVSSGIATAF